MLKELSAYALHKDHFEAASLLTGFACIMHKPSFHIFINL